MEVHPPEHGIHSWRDFLVHMGTITLGLLIALGLEHLVEISHHRHLVHTAEANLGSELESNRQLLEADRRALDDTQQQLERHLSALQNTRGHSSLLDAVTFHWEWNGPQAAAWETARDSGALALMDYERAASFAGIYEQQRFVSDQALLYLRDLYDTGTAVTGPGAATETALDRSIAKTEHTLADLKLLRDYVESLGRIYDRSVKLQSSKR